MVTINQVMACAMVTPCNIAKAARLCDAPRDVLIDAVRYRINLAYDMKIDDSTPDGYFKSVTECFKRLEAAN